MRAATEGNLPPVMPQGNLVELLGREVRHGSPGELVVEISPSRQRRPACETKKEMSDEAADAAAPTYLTYLLTHLYRALGSHLLTHPHHMRSFLGCSCVCLWARCLEGSRCRSAGRAVCVVVVHLGPSFLRQRYRCWRREQRVLLQNFYVVHGLK